MHSKEKLHRDIGPKNILLKQYDDTIVAKVSDFGLVKIFASDLSSMNTEFKGHFNDHALVTEGFNHYNIQHETYALTKLIYYIMTGKINFSNVRDSKLENFVKKGLCVDKTKRFQSVNEINNMLRTM